MHIIRARAVRRPLAVAAGVVLAITAAMAPASAHGGHDQTGAYVDPPAPFHDVGTDDAGCADVQATVAYDYRGVSSISRVRGTGGQAFFFRQAYRFSETWTETSTGKVLLTFRGRTRYAEVKARRVSEAAVPADVVPPEGLVGPVYRFTSVEKTHDAVRDAEGRRLYRDAGVVVYSSLFDTLGDHAPGGTQLTFDPVKVIGPHPLLTVDLCDVAARQAS